MRTIVTGATNGIGEAVVRRLAGEGHQVVLAGRDDARLRSARDRICDAVPGADLQLERADFARLDEVRALADRLAAAPPADTVISNAALVAPRGRRTPDGLPLALAVNHLAPYLLLRVLAESLGGRRARFVVVGGDPVSLAGVPLDLDDLTFTRPEPLDVPEVLLPVAAYARTKNMNAMFGFALARRLAGTGITVNGAHPGIIGGTGLDPGGPEVIAAMAELFGYDPTRLPGPDVGADTPAWLATSPDVEGVTGRFFVDRTAVDTAPHTTDIARTDRLWEASAALVGLPVELATPRPAVGGRDADGRS